MMLTQAKDLIRNRYIINNRNDNTITIGDKSLINFSSNDYLGIAEHPVVKQAFINGIQQYGNGSSSSALVSGFYHSHRMLEDAFAEFLNRDRAILFNSGYLANIGVITALANRSGKIFVDKLCHTSTLDGIRLSRAKFVRYAHNDVNHLATLLSQSSNNSLVITESIFSMEGKISPINQIVTTTQAHPIKLMVDDAHAAGVLGKNGRGICEYYNLSQQDVPCLIVPLSKAFASMGSIVSGSQDLIECLIQFSKTYCYTTALPPAIANATLAALKIVETENWRRAKLQELIKFFIVQAKQRNLALLSEDLTPIKPILIGDNDCALQIKEALMQKGFFVSCIRPPTVPQDTARIRVALNCLHHEKDIIDLLDLMAFFHDKFS
ncbi:MAG: 8-amino-7-oxononanoate synthase [Pseudomonadota bacterium]